MGTQAGLPKLNANLDNETKKIMKILGGIKLHGLAKIAYTTKGEYYSPKFDKWGTAECKKDGEQKMSKGGFLKKFSDKTRKVLRPEEIMQPNGKMVSIKSIDALVLAVFSVNHNYETLIKNQMKKLGLDPASFTHEDCKYSKKFSDNGLVRQHINPAKDRTFYFRYFTGLNNITYKTYEVIYLNENGETVILDQAFKDTWFNQSAPSQKQGEAGLEKEIKPRNLGLDNLLYFQKGDDIFNSRMTDEIMKLLNLEWV